MPRSTRRVAVDVRRSTLRSTALARAATVVGAQNVNRLLLRQRSSLHRVTFYRRRPAPIAGDTALPQWLIPPTQWPMPASGAAFTAGADATTLAETTAQTRLDKHCRAGPLRRAPCCAVRGELFAHAARRNSVGGAPAPADVAGGANAARHDVAGMRCSRCASAVLFAGLPVADWRSTSTSVLRSPRRSCRPGRRRGGQRPARLLHGLANFHAVCRGVRRAVPGDDRGGTLLRRGDEDPRLRSFKRLHGGNRQPGVAAFSTTSASSTTCTPSSPPAATRARSSPQLRAGASRLSGWLSVTAIKHIQAGEELCHSLQTCSRRRRSAARRCRAVWVRLRPPSLREGPSRPIWSSTR